MTVLRIDSLGVTDYYVTVVCSYLSGLYFISSIEASDRLSILDSDT